MSSDPEPATAGAKKKLADTLWVLIPVLLVLWALAALFGLTR